MAEATRIAPEPVVQPPEKVVLEMSVREARAIYDRLAPAYLNTDEFAVFHALRRVL